MSKKDKFESLRQKHLSEGGRAPDEYAVTEMIKEAIENKSYRVYQGGGFYTNDGRDPEEREKVEFYDIVVWFTWGNDPEFAMAGEHDLDCVELYSCDSSGKLMSMMK